MTLLQIIHTIPPDTAKLIDEVLEFSSEVAESLQLGDGKADRDGPDGWSLNKLMRMTLEKLTHVLNYLQKSNCRKASYYTDFSGELMTRK